MTLDYMYDEHPLSAPRPLSDMDHVQLLLCLGYPQLVGTKVPC